MFTGAGEQDGDAASSTERKRQENANDRGQKNDEMTWEVSEDN